MDFRDIRRLVIISMFSDDTLMERLVLKGGNALDLVHHIGSRTSLDIDLSIEDEFENIEEIGARIRDALERRFLTVGVEVFDFRFRKKPKVETERRDPPWGGYIAEFKLMEAERYSTVEPQSRSRQAITVGSGQKRTFRVEISKHEYCRNKVPVELDDFTIFVYTPEMIAFEKLRAICQQMPRYLRRRTATPRARDFYDIYSVVESDIFEMNEDSPLLFRHIFAAKDVPVELVGEIPDQREFHRTDWRSVIEATGGDLEAYDFYFDYVVAWTNDELQSFWKV